MKERGEEGKRMKEELQHTHKLLDPWESIPIQLNWKWIRPGKLVNIDLKEYG